MSCYIILFFTLQLSLISIGCGSNDQESADHEHEGTSVTLWTDKTELFMEYPALVVGQEAAFAVHLSDLNDFKPVTRGRLTCVFEKNGYEPVTAVAEAPSYPGIFRPVVIFQKAGVYKMELQLQSSQVSDTIRVRTVGVYADEANIPHTAGGNTEEELISFLKEQQWKIDFRTEPVRRHRLWASVQAVGEILSKHGMHAAVPAPVNGVILAERNTSIPDIGTAVTKGQVLAVISPPANAETSINTVRAQYLLAKAEYERAQRLFDKQAISERRLREAKLRYEGQKAGYEVISQQVDFGTSDDLDGAASVYFHLKSPIDGIVQEIHFDVGETLDAGEKLFTITNPSRVILRANVSTTNLSRIRDSQDASFTVEGNAQEFSVSELDGQLMAIGSLVQEKSRTVPVTFELMNPKDQLKIGMFAEVRVKTSETVETLAIPNSALFDEDGTPIAYVHVAGEAFAKRVLETGITDQGYTQILSGISEGERVVTIGGYQVRLASLSTSVPVGHGHEH